MEEVERRLLFLSVRPRGRGSFSSCTLSCFPRSEGEEEREERRAREEDMWESSWEEYGEEEEYEEEVVDESEQSTKPRSWWWALAPQCEGGEGGSDWPLSATVKRVVSGVLKGF